MAKRRPSKKTGTIRQMVAAVLKSPESPVGQEVEAPDQAQQAITIFAGEKDWRLAAAMWLGRFDAKLVKIYWTPVFLPNKKKKGVSENLIYRMADNTAVKIIRFIDCINNQVAVSIDRIEL